MSFSFRILSVLLIFACSTVLLPTRLYASGKLEAACRSQNDFSGTCPSRANPLVTTGLRLNSIFETETAQDLAGNVKDSQLPLATRRFEEVLIQHCRGLPVSAATPPRVPLRPQKISRAISLPGENSKYQCGFFDLIEAARVNPEESLLATAEKTNWDPCCLSEDIKRMLTSTNRNVRGFSIGFDTSLSATVAFRLGPAGTYGKELVMLRTGADTLQIAVVESRGFSVSMGLALGVGVTQAILHDKCEKIEDYLGYFKSLSAGGLQVINYGMSGSPYDLTARRTHCDSDSVTTGTTTTLASIAGSHYSQISPAIELKGRRIKPLLDLMDQVNNDSVTRQNGKSILPPAPIEYQMSQYRKPNCNDQIGEQMYRHLKSTFTH